MEAMRKGTNMETENMPIGVVNCSRLHIYSKPDLESDIICTVCYSTEVVIDLGSSTEDLYKIYTAFGAEGFCQKSLITIN